MGRDVFKGTSLNLCHGAPQEPGGSNPRSDFEKAPRLDRQAAGSRLGHVISSICSLYLRTSRLIRCAPQPRLPCVFTTASNTAGSRLAARWSQPKGACNYVNRRFEQEGPPCRTGWCVLGGFRRSRLGCAAGGRVGGRRARWVRVRRASGRGGAVPQACESRRPVAKKPSGVTNYSKLRTHGRRQVRRLRPAYRYGLTRIRSTPNRSFDEVEPS